MKLVILLALATCSMMTLISGAASGAPPQRCSAGGNRVLFSYGDVAIVKSVDGSLQTCTPDLPGLGPLALPGHWFPLPAVDLNQTTVGYTLLNDDGLRINSLNVGGANRDEADYFIGVPYRPVGSLRVWPDGPVAWIACGRARDANFGLPSRADPRPNCVRPGPSMKRVFLFTQHPNRVRQIARSRGIDPRSLRRSGQTFTWRDRGHRRVAMIP